MQGLIQAHRRSEVTQNLQARPATACAGAWLSWDRRHLIQCIEEDDTARSARPRAPRPHPARLFVSCADSQARGRYNLSQDHGRLYISYRRTPSVHTHGGGLKHTGQHEGRPCRLCPEDGIFARIRGRRGHILSSPGSQYISSKFAACSAAHDVRLSVGRTGSCHDNALAKSFFATLKNEWYYHKRLLDASTTKHKAHEFNRVVLQPLPPA